jgi:hypothetical protein
VTPVQLRITDLFPYRLIRRCQGRQDVIVLLLHELESRGRVVVLEHGLVVRDAHHGKYLIVVQRRQWGLRSD